MSSQLKSETARINGAKSKGPVTAEGKHRSSRNALKHGLSAQVIVLPHEDRPLYERLRDSYFEDFQPATQSEADLVEAMVTARWRLNRAAGIEAKLFEKETELRRDDIRKEFETTDEEGILACVFERLANQGKSLSLLTRYESQLNRAYDHAFKQLQSLQSQPIGPRETRAGPPAIRASFQRPKITPKIPPHPRKTPCNSTITPKPTAKVCPLDRPVTRHPNSPNPSLSFRYSFHSGVVSARTLYVQAGA